MAAAARPLLPRRDRVIDKYAPKDSYTPAQRDEVAAYVLNAIADGDTVKRALKALKVSTALWYYWLINDIDLLNAFARARVVQCHTMAESLDDIARDAYGQPPEYVAAARLHSENIRFFVSKIAPKLYGDRLDLTTGGERIGVIALPDEALPGIVAHARLLLDGEAASESESPAVQREDAPDRVAEQGEA